MSQTFFLGWHFHDHSELGVSLVYHLSDQLLLLGSVGTRRQQCLSIGDLIVVDCRLSIVLVHGAHLPYTLGSILHRVGSVGSLTDPLRVLGH